MFTGIVREQGRVLAVRATPSGARLAILCRLKTHEGDSVCVNGVCLSARPLRGGVGFDVVPETLRRTNLGDLAPGDAVNLEPSLRVGDPVGGHFVTGHVDGIGRIDRKRAIGEGAEIRVRVPPPLAPYLAPKGSVALDGVSLTIMDSGRDWVSLALIPLTLEKTTLGKKGRGDTVNVEVDLLARYTRRGGVTRELLREAGFFS